MHEPENLCAVMLLLTCSPRFEGPSTFFVNSHARGAAELLKLREFPAGQADFESILFSTLRDTVVIKSIVDKGIQFSEEQWKAFESLYQDDHPVARLMRWALQLGQLIGCAREAVAGSNEERATYLQAIRMQQKLDQITMELQDLAYNKDIPNSKLTDAVKGHAQKLRNYSQGLCISAQLICMRRTLLPVVDSFIDEINILSKRVPELAEGAQVYRPLGAHWVVIVLMTMWSATTGTPFQLGREDMLDCWRRDTLGERSVAPRKVLQSLYECLSVNRGQAIARNGGAEASMSSLVFLPARTAPY